MAPRCLIGFVVMAAAIWQCAFAAVHTVGGSTGWTIPSSPTLYPNWASSQTIKVNDKLLFNFQTGLHNVMEVSKSEYDACTATNPIQAFTTGPATVLLNRTGMYYFICSVGQHCVNGQKINISVLAASSPAQSPAPVSSPPATSPATPKRSPSPAPSTLAPSPKAETPSPVTVSPSPSVVSVPPPKSGIAVPPSVGEGPSGSPTSSPNSGSSVAAFGWLTLLAVAIPIFFSR